jgi:hypothetical protein
MKFEFLFIFLLAFLVGWWGTDRFRMAGQLEQMKTEAVKRNYGVITNNTFQWK